MSIREANITRVVKAEDLTKEIMQGASKLPPSTHTGARLLPLSNARIKGKLILKHCTINRPVVIRDCLFEDEVDLRYCEFEQVVDFRGCIFKGELNSGDKIESHTIYRKDLICSNVRFEGPARFNGVKVEGSAYFEDAYFLNPDPSVDLLGASIEKSLEFLNATVKGLADFRTIKCAGYGLFRGISFCGEGPEQGRVKLTLSSFGGNLDFKGAIFRGPADLSSLKCDGDGIFEGAKFEKKVNFAFSSFGRNLKCSGETKFNGPVCSNAVRCDGTGFFEKSFIAEKIDLSSASFGGDLVFENAIVEGEADFNRLNCGGAGKFACARFGRFVEGRGEGEKVNLSLTCFGSNLSLDHAKFGGEVDMSAARISQDLNFTDAKFEQKVVLYNASSDQLKLEGKTFPFEDVLNLREYTFGGFSGPEDDSEERALRFAKCQDKRRFSRDPYLQLEKYYNSIGDDGRAKRTHYEGRREHRRASYKPNELTKWSMRFVSWCSAELTSSGDWWLELTDRGKRFVKRHRTTFTSWGDWWLKWLTGYGVRTGRLLFPIGLTLLIGFFVLSVPNEALKAVETGSSAASAEFNTKPRTDGKRTMVTSPGKNGNLEGTKPGKIDRFTYPLDLFLPIDLGVTDEWEPQTGWREIYVFGHSLLGWILIPLLITSLSGIIRRQ